MAIQDMQGYLLKLVAAEAESRGFDFTTSTSWANIGTAYIRKGLVCARAVEFRFNSGYCGFESGGKQIGCLRYDSDADMRKAFDFFFDGVPTAQAKTAARSSRARRTAAR